MSVVVLPSANQIIRQFADFPDVDMRFANKAAFETAIVNVARIPDGWLAYCIAEKNWFFADKAAGTAAALGTGEGTAGKSAYEVAVDNGFIGTEEEWLESLIGPKGDDGEQGPQGEPGNDGATGATGPTGVGIASGGNTNQVLKKKSATDYDTEWADAILGTKASDNDLETQSTPSEDNKFVSRRGLMYWWNWVKLQYFVFRSFGLEKLSTAPSTLNEGQIWKEGDKVKVRLASSTKELAYTDDVRGLIVKTDVQNPSVNAYYLIPDVTNLRLFFGETGKTFSYVDMSNVGQFSNLPALSMRSGLIVGGLGSHSIYRDGNNNIAYNGSSNTVGRGKHLFYVDETTWNSTGGSGNSTLEFEVGKGFVKANKFTVSDLNTPPSSATATGTKGEIRYTSDYIYVCIATNTWVRSPLTTW